MEKFQKIFIERIQKTVKEWRAKQAITNQELFRFLHSLKGTSASISLDELTHLAESLLNSIDKDTHKDWNTNEWIEFLQPVITYVNLFKTSQIQDLVVNEVPIKQEQKYGNDLILLIEDDPEMIELLKDNLEAEHYQVLIATNAEKALLAFYQHFPDCVILDILLPDGNGIDILQQIIDKSTKRLIPVLLMSADNSSETRIKAYDLGAMDYIVKPFQIEEVVSLVNNRMRFKDTMSSRILRDELTGAYNRKFFKEEIERQLTDYKRNQNPFCISLLDLDYFKKINDTYGHDVGDEVLKQFAKLIMESKRKSDYFIRYGGEEFLLIMPQTDANIAKNIVNRHLENFSRYKFSSEGYNFHCTFSSGITEMSATVNHEEQLVKQADLALYQAKENGRNQVIIYDSQAVSAIQKEPLIHIGIVDDDPVILQLLTEHFYKLKVGNYRVEVKGFREGESFFSSDWHKKGGKYILLLDGIMPRMDGIEILKEIRQNYHQEDNIIIMLTARKKDYDIVTALQLGADDYITKPFSLAELEARVKRFAKRLI